jgi:hypothetical protein
MRGDSQVAEQLTTERVECAILDQLATKNVRVGQIFRPWEVWPELQKGGLADAEIGAAFRSMHKKGWIEEAETRDHFRLTEVWWLETSRRGGGNSTPRGQSVENWDVFISHASEDKDEIARPLARSLQAVGLKVWYDEFALKVGDSLSASIQQGLARSRYGIIIISPNFIKKRWPQEELSALISASFRKHLDGPEARGAIFPIIHNIDYRSVGEELPLIANIIGLESSRGLDHLRGVLVRAMHSVFPRDKPIGMWSGVTGRLRLIPTPATDYGQYLSCEGEYDWKGHEWSGKLVGDWREEIFSFKWNWNVSGESGIGFFTIDKESRALQGGWKIGDSPDLIHRLSIELLSTITTPWRFDFKH